MEPLHTLTMSLMALPTTWVIPTPLKVRQWHWISTISSNKLTKFLYCIWLLSFVKSCVLPALTGAHYNIICVPPTKKSGEETLEGATVLCSIPSKDKTRPSYYHSFGEPNTTVFTTNIWLTLTAPETVFIPIIHSILIFYNSNVEELCGIYWAAH